MKIRRSGVQGIAIIVAAIGLAAGFHRAGQWLADSLNKKEIEQNLLPVIGRVSQVEGRVLLKRFGDLRGQWVRDGNQLNLDIRDLDTLQVESKTTVKVDLPNGYQLSIEPDSLVVFEKWNSNDAASPVYAHVLQGSLTSDKKGERGKLFVIQNGQMSYPEGVMIKKTRELVVHSVALDPETVVSEVSLTPSPAVSVSPVPVDGASLSDEYLDEMIGAQREHFQRCQANALRDGLAAKGRLVVGLKIQPSGQIEELHLISNDIGNSSLEKCVLDVFSRVRFKTFSGAPIARSYPLTLE